MDFKVMAGVIATGYDIGTCDGMNEKGLVAGLLFLPESVYDRPETPPRNGHQYLDAVCT